MHQREEPENRKPHCEKVDALDLTHLPEEHHEEIRAMLHKHSPMWNGALGEINLTEHRIELLPGARPVSQSPYRQGPKGRKFEDEEVRRMLKDGVVQPSTSEWGSPVVLAPKADGSLRFCVDYRKVNELSLRDSYPIPRMDECIDSFGDANIFTTLDANCGFWQVPVAKEDIPKTAFVTHNGLFEFRRMPFGLTNAPATFQRALDIALAAFKWKTCIVYIDDVVIFSKTIGEHLEHVDTILTALAKAGISLKFAKCDFFSKQIKYLGHIIKPGRLEVDKAHTKSLRESKPPRTVTQLRSFLGGANVYRRFIKNYAMIAAPLHKLLKGLPENCGKGSRHPVEFGEDELAAFHTLLKCITSPPVLALPVADRRLSIDTDASAEQIGCALFQEDEGGERMPLGYWSRQLLPAEANYSATERECLALVWGVQILRPYLLWSEFDAHTDHSALRWLMTIKDPSGRLMRWRLRLSEFRFVPKYKKGTSNQVADMTSRVPSDGHTTVCPDLELPCYSIVDADGYLQFDEPTEGDSDDEDDASFFLEERDAHYDQILAGSEEPESEEPARISLEEVQRAQEADPFCINMRTRIQNGEEVPFQDDPTSGALMRNTYETPQLVIPKELQPRFLTLAHKCPTSGHLGGRKMYRTMRRQYYFPSMAIACYNTVRNCMECAKERVRIRKTVHYLKLFPATEPLMDIAMDLCGPFLTTKAGNKYILVITDRYTKLMRTTPLPNQKAETVAKAFVRDWVFTYGPPRSVVSDNGKQFVSKFLLEVYRILGIREIFTTTYHPQTNGQTERFNRTLVGAVRKYVADHPTWWDRYTDSLTYAYNTQVNETTDHTPFELVLSSPPQPMYVERRDMVEQKTTRETSMKWLQRLDKMFKDASEALALRQARYKRSFDASVKRRRVPKVGESILVRKEQATRGESWHKLSPRAFGPFKVVDVSEDGRTLTYQNGGSRELVNVNRVELAPVEEVANDEGQAGTNDDTESETTGLDAVVDSIIGHAPVEGKPENYWQVHVKWFNDNQPTWEPLKNMRYSQVAKYCHQNGLAHPSNMEETRRD